MVNINEVIEELRKTVKKKGESEGVFLYLICNNYMDFGEIRFSVEFEENYGLNSLKVNSGGIMDDLASEGIYPDDTEEGIEAYGEWYEVLREYEDDLDEFRDIPLDIAAKALSWIPFDFYEIEDEY